MEVYPSLLWSLPAAAMEVYPPQRWSSPAAAMEFTRRCYGSSPVATAEVSAASKGHLTLILAVQREVARSSFSKNRFLNKISSENARLNAI